MLKTINVKLRNAQFSMERKQQPFHLGFSFPEERKQTHTEASAEAPSKQHSQTQQTSLGIQDLKVLTVQMIWKEIISLATPPKLALLASVIGLFSVS